MNAQKITFFVCLIASVIMLTAGFIVPPTGIIDGSVLTAVGELFGFATLATLPSVIHGRQVELKHGETQLTLSDDD